MASVKVAQEPDFIRRAFRVLNLQAVIALILVIILPIAASYRIVGDLFSDMGEIWVTYSEQVRDEFMQNPIVENAQLLARKRHVVIAEEGAQGIWYTDGESVSTVNLDAERPYYNGLSRRFNIADGGRLVVT